MSKKETQTDDSLKNTQSETAEPKEVQEKETEQTKETANESEKNAPEEKADEKDEVTKLQDEVKSLKDQHLRLYAEFENHRKRTAKERLELFGTANQELMGALLPVMDDFERALKNLDEEAASGVQLIYNKFESTLKNKGLKPMEDTTGKEFDVETMEAITRIPAPDKKMKGKVVDQIEKGYLLGNKIIRYAKVVVGE